MMYFVESHLGSYYITDNFVPKYNKNEEYEDADRLIFAFHKDNEKEKYDVFCNYFNSELSCCGNYSELGNVYEQSLRLISYFYGKSYFCSELYTKLRDYLDKSYLINLQNVNKEKQRKRKPKLFS